ncbi:methyltransferase domain-containing protein [Streptosporangium sp. NPDC005286]|uniref:SAM-dependent methyltransferase n=1 Tax=Streptosporangium sp. NPDC005286 TaxID=3154463 RepID=UPI00339F27DF
MSIERLRTNARDFTEGARRPLSTRGFNSNAGQAARTPVRSPKEIGEFYDRNSRVLTEVFAGSMHYGYWTGPDDDTGFAAASERLTAIMIEKLRVGPDDTVLDLGCGTGKPAVQLARATGARVVGVSVSAEEVELASALARSEGVADLVRFEFADATDLPFAPGSFDAVLALESVVHIPDRINVLQQIARVLRPGGRLALTDSITGRGAEGDEEAELAMAEVLDAWRHAPQVRAGNYPRFLREAGLVADEITDIAENVKYTYGKLYAAMDEYVRKHGDLPPDLARIFDLGDGVDWAEQEKEPQRDGIVIIAAHRSDTSR